MKLLAKFNLIFILFLGAGSAMAAWASYEFLKNNAKDQVKQQAELMMEAATSIRRYTADEIRPLLQKTQMHTTSFLAQTVPAYGAMTSMNYLRKTYPEYSYKEATLNPTNLRDRAVDWEADVIRLFRDNPGRVTFSGERQTPTGPSLYLSKPIKADATCLECHSTPDKAPRAMLRVYGSANGFGWKPNEIIGAQIVSVPMSLPEGIANRAFRKLLVYLAAICIGTLVVVDLALLSIVIRPVKKLSRTADLASKGEVDGGSLPVKGRDEIATLTASFNRMFVSLAKALKLLES